MALLHFTGTTFVTNVAKAPEIPKSDKGTTGPTLAEKVGQLFIVGHWNETLTSETSALIDELNLGGIIIMDAKSDARGIRSQTSTWQNVSYPTPLLVGIDQEGGLVSRLKDDIYIQTAQPDITDLNNAYNVASARGKALASLGINTNFSPVIDSSTKPESFMYERVFRDPSMIAGLGDSMVRGYQNNGVLAVPKHFPGHPDTADDSHMVLPILSEVDFEMYKAHTQPFTDLVRAGNTSLLMTAHVQVPSLDEEYPATLSKTVLNDLRERVGYEGVIMTDDLAMRAVSDYWSYEESAVLALRAGADMLMLAAEPEFASSTITAVIKAVEDGRLPLERVEDAYSRVMIVKERI